MFVATLFDYNGVLVDDEHVHLAAFRDVLGPLGIELDEAEYFDRYIGFDDAGAFRAILVDNGRTTEDRTIAQLIEAKRPHYMRRALGELRLFSGAADLVQRMAAHGPVGVVSGALRDEVELGLERLGVRESVAFVVSAEDTRACKPDPEGYEKALSELGQRLSELCASRVLVIEDSIAGVRSAKAAGLVCLAVTHSASARALEQAGADWVVDDVGSVGEHVLEALAAKLASAAISPRSA